MWHDARMPRFQPHARPLRFGVFMPPMHKTGVNPTLALHRDLQLVEHLDRLGYAEAWIGEHHSAGSELIAFTSSILTLKPGDIITTGMPHGIGDEVYLKAGDVVEGEIAGLGVLRNPVIAEV